MARPSGQGVQLQPDELTSLKVSLEKARAALHIAEAATHAISELTLAARDAMSESDRGDDGVDRCKAFAAIAAICGQARRIVAVEAGSEALEGLQAAACAAPAASVATHDSALRPKQHALDPEANEATQSAVLLESLQCTLDGYLARLQAQVQDFSHGLPDLHARLTFAQQLGCDKAAASPPSLDDEGAGLLALKTRHQLTSVPLSLASHAERSVLRDF